jgi:hypothetical protein
MFITEKEMLTLSIYKLKKTIVMVILRGSIIVKKGV